VTVEFSASPRHFTFQKGHEVKCCFGSSGQLDENFKFH